MSTTPPCSAPRAATTLAVWAAALAGGASADSALDAFAASGMPAAARGASAQAAGLCGLPGPGEAHTGLAGLLPLLRTAGTPTLLLPVPGDLRGLPPGSAITVAALDAGAAVVLPSPGIGLVPQDGHWRAYPCAADHPTLPEWDARRLVDGALRDATVALDRAGVARERSDARESIRRAILDEEVPLPPGVPSTASGLLAQSITLHAVLSVAARHETAAATAAQLGLVTSALAPLAAAVRESRRTAVALAVAALHPDAVAIPRR